MEVQGARVRPPGGPEDTACEGDIARIESVDRSGVREHRNVSGGLEDRVSASGQFGDIECPCPEEIDIAVDGDQVGGLGQTIVTGDLPFVRRVGAHIQGAGDRQRIGAAAGSDAVRATDVHDSAGVDRAGAGERRTGLVVDDTLSEVHDAVDLKRGVAPQFDPVGRGDAEFLDGKDTVV